MTDLWEKVLALEDKNPAFSSICEGVTVELADDQERVTLTFPQHFKMDYFKTEYAEIVQRQLAEILSHHIELSLRVNEKQNISVPPYADRERQRENNIPPSQSLVAEPRPSPKITITPPLRPRFTLENFVTGRSNENAFIAIQEITDWVIARAAQSDLAAPDANPLFLVGDVSYGKTHLLQSVVHAILSSKIPLHIVYVGAQQFVADYTRTAQLQQAMEWDRFQQRYYRADVFLIDDIHVFGEGKKERSQQELITILNLLAWDKTLIIVSSVQPRDNLSLKRELMSRLGEFQTAEIATPDFALIAAIIMKKADVLGLPLTEEQAELIAERLDTDLRRCEGAVKNLMSEYRLGRAVDLPMIQRHFGKEPKTERFCTPAKIQEIVALHYNLTIDQLIHGGRTQRIAEARMIAMYLCKTILDMQLIAIGRAFDKKEHTTVRYAIGTVGHDIAHSEYLRTTVETLTHILDTLPKRVYR